MIEIDTRYVHTWHEPCGPQRARYTSRGVVLEAMRHYGEIGWCWQVRIAGEGHIRAHYGGGGDTYLHPLDALRAAAAWVNQEAL